MTLMAGVQFSLSAITVIIPEHFHSSLPWQLCVSQNNYTSSGAVTSLPEHLFVFRGS